jgi:prepilin-type N-terminal cleavage/methylation domain-containing protein
LGAERAHVRRLSRGGGFSLIELIAVLVIAAIMAGIAVPTLSTLASTRAAAAAKLIARDLTYARERAMTTGSRTWVVFNTGSNSYSVLQEPAGTPGRVNAVSINDPSTQKAWVQTLGTAQFSGVSITAASFDSAAEIGFDWLGKPLNSAQASLAANGTVTLTGSQTVTVQAGSGLTTTP